MYELEFLRRVSFVVLTGHFITEELVFVRCITSVSELVFEKGGKCEFFFVLELVSCRLSSHSYKISA